MKRFVLLVRVLANSSGPSSADGNFAASSLFNTALRGAFGAYDLAHNTADIECIDGGSRVNTVL